MTGQEKSDLLIRVTV